MNDTRGRGKVKSILDGVKGALIDIAAMSLQAEPIIERTLVSVPRHPQHVANFLVLDEAPRILKRAQPVMQRA